MRRHFQQVGSELVVGWLLAAIATLVYLLTLEPSVSFWDSGEFIAVSYLLQVGHPPGAPFYQLLAHAFSWFAPSPMLVARCCNALSAVSGGLTVMFLFWTILLLSPADKPKPLVAAAVGALCYLFCDTAWFSAVESEVYSLAMLIASVILWAMLRWYRCTDPLQAPRCLCLIALLLGLGVCTHLLTLLTTPVLLLLFIFKVAKERKEHPDKKHGKSRYKSQNLQSLFRISPCLILFFLIGLTPYLIIPIRAAAGTPINEGHPSTYADFKTYITREQYEKAPLYPRMWRHHKNDALYASDWSGGDTTLVGNLRYYGSYQLTYMYLRYLMWNFAGRYNDRQGYGSPQNGQFITGIPPVDRLLVGTGARPPDSLHTRGHNNYFLLPLLLGLVGVYALLSRRRAFWTVFTLFLMGGVILSLYLNHPTYEPRERDYAYILSFYAFCIFIAFGVQWLVDKAGKVTGKARRPLTYGICLVVFAVPALMAFQNWDDHDRSHRYIAHDAGANILHSCDRHPQGTVLFTYGDNDTFPLWYLQAVEGMRLDIRVENIGLMGRQRFADLFEESVELSRPIYFTHYAYDHFRQFYPGRLQLEGNAYRLMPYPCDSVATAPFLRHLDSMEWHPVQHVYVDETGCKFIEQYWRDVLLLAQNLIAQGEDSAARHALGTTLGHLPVDVLQDPRLVYDIAQACLAAGDTAVYRSLTAYLRATLAEQLDYYHTMSRARQATMPYTLAPREELMHQLTTEL